MKFPDSISAQDFLRKYWEKKPLSVPGAIVRELPSLSPDELAWLATLEDVESRLVFTERLDGKTAYRVEHGPFATEEMQALPKNDWTLLVQDVEKHLPDFRAYFGLSAFVPDWRIDDLMVSFAAPGGSVGPHQDNYDVFLCQGSGTRTWHLADCGSVASVDDSESLRLLEEFIDERPIIARTGDILYLPPGVPHWGIATSACMTYSIGMRAPSREELLAQLDRGNRQVDAVADDGVYYRDPDLLLDEAVPGKIGQRAISRARTLLGDIVTQSDGDIVAALGMTVTELKPWISPPPMKKAEALDVLEAHDDKNGLSMHGMARLAYFEANDSSLVFANGHCRTATRVQSAFIGDICAKRGLAFEVLQHAVENDEKSQILLWCAQKGVFDL
jgi:50S ribosomal protein L16 3-hydroxylase